jgi:polyisoprenoid-binding protein YceI
MRCAGFTRGHIPIVPRYRDKEDLQILKPFVYCRIYLGMKIKYEIDPVHSSVNFSIRHLMITNVRGAFTGVKGSILFDREKPTESSVEAEIDTATINTREAQRDAHLKSADFLDVEKFPSIT